MRASAAGTMPRQAKVPGGMLPVRAVRQVPARDEIFDGRSDSGGWHLYAASSGGNWAWQPLATLALAGLDVNGERWTGRQCLTGGGRYMVAVVAPWSADNTPADADRGGVAYVIDARSGAVRPLLSGVSLYHFTPSCGPGSTAVITRYIGSDDQSAQLVLVDAARASVRAISRLRGQYADAVPGPGNGFLAVSGDSIVAVSAGRRTWWAAACWQAARRVRRGTTSWAWRRTHPAWTLRSRRPSCRAKRASPARSLRRSSPRSPTSTRHPGTPSGGVAGNPLIADYYGAGGGYVAGVTTPDCGYGLGQVTTGICMPARCPTTFSARSLWTTS